MNLTYIFFYMAKTRAVMQGGVRVEYFPFFIDIEEQPVLIVGGGAVALRKAEKLLPYKPRLRAVAPEFCPEFAALPSVVRIQRPFADSDLEECRVVIAATNDREENCRIAALCRSRGILLNAVDDRENCGFLFPALVKRGSVSIGVSTGGASPVAAAWIKEQIAALLPENLEAVIDELERARLQCRQEIPDESERAAVLRSRLLHLLKLNQISSD